MKNSGIPNYVILEISRSSVEQFKNIRGQLEHFKWRLAGIQNHKNFIF